MITFNEINERNEQQQKKSKLGSIDLSFENIYTPTVRIYLCVCVCVRVGVCEYSMLAYIAFFSTLKQ